MECLLSILLILEGYSLAHRPDILDGGARSAVSNQLTRLNIRVLPAGCRERLTARFISARVIAIRLNFGRCQSASRELQPARAEVSRS